MRAALLLIVTACSSAPSGEPAPAVKEGAPVVATTTAGEVITTSFESAALGVEKAVVVYLPAGYAAQPGKRWPVFYYLHGLTGNETNWINLGLAQAADAMTLGAIVVMPDGDNGFYADSVTPLDYDACMRDGTGLFVPNAPKKATWLAMRHPELFAATASHSGVDALLYQGPDPYVAGKAVLGDDPKKAPKDPFTQWIVGIFGSDIANWRAHDPASLVEKLQPGTLAIYLDCGTEDDFRLHNGAQYLHDLLLAKKIEHAWYLGPGKHDGAFWRSRVPHSLTFLAANVASAK